MKKIKARYLLATWQEQSNGFYWRLLYFALCPTNGSRRTGIYVWGMFQLLLSAQKYQGRSGSSHKGWKFIISSPLRLIQGIFNHNNLENVENSQKQSWTLNTK